MTATVISLVAFKGGVAKTSSSMMIAFTLAKRGYKTLLVDLDPQANLTAVSLRTKLAQLGQDADTSIDSSLMRAIQDGDLSEAEVNIMPNLNLIGSSMDFSMYPQFMMEKYKSYAKQVQYFDKLLEPVAKDFDYVIIDTPPALSIYMASALYASDFALCLMKTDPFSNEGMNNLLKYIQNEVINNYKAPRLEPLGILAVMMHKKNALDTGILEMTKQQFGSDTLLPVVPYMARLSRYAATGVSDGGYFDKRPHEAYGKITDEILKRVKDNEQ